MTQEKGIYLSQKLFYKYRNAIPPTKYVVFQDSKTNQDIQLLYKGILLKGVESEYTKSKYFVYMPYSLIYEKLKPTKIEGYTLFSNSYDKYIKQKEMLEDKSYKVTTYKEFDDIQTFIDKLNVIQEITICSITIIGVFILGYLYRTYINERKIEFAMLKSLGLTNSNISTLTFLETLIMSMIGTIGIIFIVVLFTDFQIFEVCLYEIIILLFIYLFIRFKIIRLKPIEVLRNR